MVIAQKPFDGTVEGMQEGRLNSSLQDLLGRFGIEKADTIDSVVHYADEVLQQRGHAASVVGLRHGELRIAADGTGARLLDWDIDQVKSAIEQKHPGVVSAIIIVRRGAKR